MSGGDDRVTVLCVAGDDAESSLAEHPRVAVRSAGDPTRVLSILSTGSVDCVVGATESGVRVLPTAVTAVDELAAVVTGDAAVDVPEDLGDRVVAAAARGEGRPPVGSPRRFRELVEHTTDALWMFDADWETLLFVNSAYETLFGRSVGELRERPESFLDAVHPGDRERVRAAMARLSEGESVSVEYRVVDADDGVRWVQSKGEPVAECGEVVRVAGFTRDVTARLRRERELERQNERLDRFASVVSHDLRNPLNVAQGRLELAREACDSEHLATVADAHERMADLIADLLTLARDGEGDDESVALAGFAEACWGTVDTGNATLHVETERTLTAREGPLARLFENLFRNSVEHGAPPVTVTVGDTNDGFYVADDGPGVPEGERERVFEAGHSTTDSGMGIGLDIVASVAAAHGWTVSLVESETGGARFEVGVD